ncbi:hypothetical protein ES332_A11G002500v1 [Gossypium tomentosum]|uniref:Secreted protein n=1 Tax=Gossypium tomentosum TaxID=34277 RepID=A0A5D2N5D7_GOSTO|nr:hypothetical protein ES332_A11G002500v1 [Gossypium tomentosum]
MMSTMKIIAATIILSCLKLNRQSQNSEAFKKCSCIHYQSGPIIWQHCTSTILLQISIIAPIKPETITC